MGSTKFYTYYVLGTWRRQTGIRIVYWRRGIATTTYVHHSGDVAWPTLYTYCLLATWTLQRNIYVLSSRHMASTYMYTYCIMATWGRHNYIRIAFWGHGVDIHVYVSILGIWSCLPPLPPPIDPCVMAPGRWRLAAAGPAGCAKRLEQQQQQHQQQQQPQ